MRLLEKPLFHFKAGEEVPGALARTGALVSEADLYITVSSEMNHTIAPGLVSLMSHFGSGAYSFKPSGIVTYSAGMWAGTRAGVALRPFLSELGCLPVSSMVALPGAIKAMGGVGDDDASSAMLREAAQRSGGAGVGGVGALDLAGLLEEAEARAASCSAAALDMEMELHATPAERVAGEAATLNMCAKAAKAEAEAEELRSQIVAAASGSGGSGGSGGGGKGTAVRDLPETQEKMLDRMLDQLEWHARSLRDARLRDGPPSASYFEQVRGGGGRGGGGGE